MLRRTAATFIAATLLCWLAAGLLLNTAAAAPTPSRAASARLQGDETATASPTSPPSTNITLSGTVYDLSLGPSAVISGAVVSVLVCQPRRFSTETGPDGYFNAHITVMRPEEIKQVGGADKISERGKQFHYTISRLYSVEPEGWPEMAKVWFLRVHSPELQQLRRSYGLSSLPKDGKHDFHVSVAVRRKGVLGRNETRKDA